MNADLWSKVKDIFYEALDLEPGARDAHAINACGGDEALLSEVRSLLASHEGAGDFIEPVAENNNNTLRRGSDIGPYRIVQMIGEGGMGTVYQAVRSDDLYRKLVALKVIRCSPYDEFTRNKFDVERQILAHLDHPNIAKLLDGGVTPDGHPFFVMDYIAGTPIDEYCNSEKLSIEDRLKLFLTVCSAVHYAHQNLIIHRDLKPQNILVTPEGSLRLLDFGIAKLIDPEKEPALETVSLMLMMTPEYASPEQLRGEPVTTVSDVYSLGVLLYLLLTGHKPYTFSSRAPHDVWSTISQSEPRRASTVVTCPIPLDNDKEITPEEIAVARALRGVQLAKRLNGDLDNVVAMALRKEPERRYSSVEQFARDIERHLAGLPVIAREDTIRYRTNKFVRRHWTGVVAAAVIVFTLLGGIIATSHQAHVATRERALAEQRFNDVRGLANTVLFELHDAIEPLPGSTKARELLVRKAQQYLDKLAGEATENPSLQHERAMAYERIGDVLGLTTQSNLGKTAESLAAYQKALSIETALASAAPDDSKLERDLMRTYNRVCRVDQSAGKFDDALTNCQRAMRIGERWKQHDPNDRTLRAELAATYQNVAGAYSVKGAWPQSRDFRLRALREFDDMHRLDPANQQYQFALAVAYLRYANILEQLGEFPPARDNALKSVGLFNDLLRKRPTDPRARLNTTFALQRVGSVLISMNDLPGALRAFLQALPIRQALLAADPADARARINLANSHAAIGVTLLKLGRATNALAHFEKQKELAEHLSRTDGMHVDYQTSLSEALENIGLVHQRLAAVAASTEEKAAKLAKARSSLLEARGIYDSLRSRNAIPAEYAAVPARILTELSACDTQIKKLSSGSV